MKVRGKKKDFDERKEMNLDFLQLDFSSRPPCKHLLWLCAEKNHSRSEADSLSASWR